MKKILITLFIALTALTTTLTCLADEGMWTLYNLPQAVFERMQQEGFKLPYNDIYYGDSAIKNTVVNFSGYCSGVVVSSDGLVLTNHHCGFEAIRSHSTVDHDYMLNGFYAKSYDEELPNKNMFVSFMVEQNDITDRVMQLGYDNMDQQQRTQLLDSLENALSKEVKKNDSTLRLELKPFYERNRFYATTYRDFHDLRLVFTIPKSMGKFGGETDNWMWPRQTCDFSVFRIYADPKTNGPAKYSKDNVPYKPKHWAPISREGYREGDFAMTIGYPGSTSRYLSSYGIRERRDAKNEPRAQVRGVKQDIMLRHMRASEAVRIKYDSKYASSSNYWKNSIGMNKCIDSIGLIAQKQAFELKLRHWQDTSGYLKGKLDFERLRQLYDERFERVRAMTFFTETFYGTNELTSRAMRVHRAMPLHGPKEKPRKQYFLFSDNSDTWDYNLDREVLIALLKNYEEHVGQQYLPSFYRDIKTKFGGDYARYADHLLQKSILMKTGKRIYCNKKSFLKDCGIDYGLSLIEFMADQEAALNDVSNQIREQERYLCDAKLRMEEDLPHYSDANFTMRLSYGQVGGFTLNGKPSGYYTTAPSIVEKMDQAEQNFEYAAEPIMRELLSADDFGPYADPDSHQLQLCFLTNNDITGGNSGSPIFDGKGQLIGLAFDGNWDSLSSDINYDSHLARCIGVDIRYVLFMMDRWGQAERLIKQVKSEK